MFFGVAIMSIPIAASYEDATLALTSLIIISALFCTLTIKIEDGIIYWYFGPYFWKKRVRLSEVVRAEIVHNSWWYGWGIRSIKRGWLYNVSGFKAVQIELKNGKRVRLGTDQPENLKMAIDNEINKDLAG